MGERDSVVRLTQGAHEVELRAGGEREDGARQVWLRPLEPDGDGESLVNVDELRDALGFVLGGAVMPPPR